MNVECNTTGTTGTKPLRLPNIMYINDC